MTKVKIGVPQAGGVGPTHVQGIKEGNSKGKYEAMKGHRADGSSTAVRSSGVAKTDPIDPSMPNLSPA